MPEIYECIFSLFQLSKLIPKRNYESDEAINEYKKKLQNDMRSNRIKLYSEFGYCGC